MKRRSSIICALCTPLALSLAAHAGTVTKSTNGTDLADGASWGGAAPTLSDVATWDVSSKGAGLTLGSNAAWQGVAITGADADVSISGSGMLSLGSGGINMSASTVNLGISNNIALTADQTWQSASGKTITVSGAISGSAGLTFGALAQTVTSNTFLTNTAQTLFSNTSLSSVTGTSGAIGGAWVNSGTPVAANGYLLSNNGTTATYWLEISEGLIKGVQVQLDQVGSDITVKALQAKNASGSLGFDFNTGGNAAPLATTSTANGYGGSSTTLKLGNDATGVTMLSGLNTYSGPTSVATGILRAGIASEAGVGGAFGKDSSVSIANNVAAGIDLNGFNTRIGALNGGGALGGNITLGTGTLTVGGDNNASPATCAGVISGTGGFAKIGSGTQTLSATNTYSGGTTVSGGTLIGSKGTAFNGTQGGAFGTGDITVNSGATIIETDFFGLFGGQNTTRTVNLLGGTAIIRNTTAGGIEYFKTLNLTGGLVTYDSAKIMIRAANSGGNINSSAASSSSTIVTDIDMTLASLAVNTAQGTVPNGQDLVISGNISQNTGAGSGAKSLTKTGAGTLVLSGASTYTGGTLVSNGTLIVTGSLSGTNVTVNNGATFAGTGSVTTAPSTSNTTVFTLANGAKLDPGTKGTTGLAITTNSNGIIDFSGALGANIGALMFNLDSAANSDKLTLNAGALTLGTGALDFSDFAFTESAGFTNDVYTLIHANSDISSSLAASQFLSGDLGNGFTGTLSSANGGQDVILTVIPEPGSVLLGGLGMLALAMRRRRGDASIAQQRA